MNLKLRKPNYKENKLLSSFYELPILAILMTGLNAGVLWFAIQYRHRTEEWVGALVIGVWAFYTTALLLYSQLYFTLWASVRLRMMKVCLLRVAYTIELNEKDVLVQFEMEDGTCVNRVCKVSRYYANNYKNFVYTQFGILSDIIPVS